MHVQPCVATAIPSHLPLRWGRTVGDAPATLVAHIWCLRLLGTLLPAHACCPTLNTPQGRRFSRPKRLNSYRQWVDQYAGDAERNGPQVAGSWLPRESGDDRLLDTIMLRLRLADGLDLRRLAAQHAQVGGRVVD